MFTRTTGLVIVPLWLLAMGWLFVHDIRPRWATSDPPTVKPADWLHQDSPRAEYVISGPLGRIGALWTTYLIDEQSVRRDDLIWIDRLPFDLTPIRVDVNSVFTNEGVLDEFTVRLETHLTRTPLKLHGERFHADFSFTLEHGPSVSAFKIPLSEAGMLSGAFSPFNRFHELHVGQTWRMQVFNPLAAVMNLGPKFIPLVVAVTGEERLRTSFWEGNCRIVEAGKVRAWVDAGGEIQRQQIDLPVLGLVTMDRMPDFDSEARNSARKFQFLGKKTESE